MKSTLEIKNLKKELDLHDRAMSSSSCGITIADARQEDLPLIYVNEAFEKICGYTKEEVLGTNCRFLQGRFRDENALEQIRHAITHQEHLRIMLKNFRKDGTLFWNELNLSPVFGEAGELTHFVGIQTDVTEREEVKAQLLERTQDLEKANQELKALGEDKDRLLGTVAHDLRGPLSSIGALMEFAIDTDVKAERDEMLNMAATSAFKTLDLVNNLLDVSAIKTGRLEIRKQSVDLAEYFEDIAKSYSRSSTLKGIRFELLTQLDTPKFPLDPNRIEQVINNLIGNAIKFSERGTKVTLSATSTEERLILKVSDQGLGIPEAELPRIFGEFEKTSTRPTENEHSTGLGLSICKRITELHGGSITVESRAGQGTTFTVTLEKSDT